MVGLAEGNRLSVFSLRFFDRIDRIGRILGRFGHLPTVFLTQWHREARFNAKDAKCGDAKTAKIFRCFMRAEPQSLQRVINSEAHAYFANLGVYLTQVQHSRRLAEGAPREERDAHLR